MYYKLKLNDKVRVPPERMGEDLNTVILDVLQEQFEGSVDKEMGIFIAVTGVQRVGEGEIIYSDGGVYYDVDFEAVVLRLALQEVIEGIVVETTSFGAFVYLFRKGIPLIYSSKVALLVNNIIDTTFQSTS